MVTKTDYLTQLFTGTAGLVEAVFIPYLEIIELVRVASLSIKIRKPFLTES